jgi:hypothetical protein
MLLGSDYACMTTQQQKKKIVSDETDWSWQVNSAICCSNMFTRQQRKTESD